MILRRSPFGPSGAGETQAIGLAKEAEILRAVSGTKLPVPEVIYASNGTDGLGDAYIMSCIEGETIARPILTKRDFTKSREVFASQCGEALALLHTTNPSTLPELPLAGAAEQLTRYQELMRSMDINRPALELALQWLKKNIPEPIATVLVHGDFRLGNLMIDEEGLAAVLDWELCHLGDPREDIGWLCVNSWRFGNRDKVVGGIGDLDDLLEAYAKAGGQRFAAGEILYWELLGSFKWSIMCLMMYESFRSGQDPSIERGSIGRRASEAELDVINILETV
jgi:aminoglycoside phosphotransferase (APT) family kinase protein